MAGKGIIRYLMRRKYFGASLGGAVGLFLAGIIAWGGFNTVMEATNTLDFCISCHEMEQTVYQEYKQSVHYENRTGVRAICSDCHVPDPWVHKFIRKIKASNELLHKVLGTIDTPEKFELRRPELARRVWAAMKETDSRECRNCHSFTAMDGDRQKKRASKQHEFAIAEGQTCIDCHKGIAHRPPNEDGTPLPTLAQLAATKAAAAAAPAAPAEPAAPAPAAQPATPAPAAAASAVALDWDKIAGREVTMLYPGQTSYEWVLNGPDHGGARAYKKGERCSGCHEGEQESMGTKMVTGEKAETTPIPGKPAAIRMMVKAAHDGENLYMRFSWPAGAHAPAPFAEGGKMDPENQVKLALMIDQGTVADADRSGCWSSCHHDAKSMPDAPAGQEVTKYLPQTRTAIEVRDAPRGGWDKLKPAAELEQLMKDGVFLDLLRWKSGNGGVSEDGHVSDRRVMEGGQGVRFQGELKDGQWTVTMTRRLKSDKPGDVSIEPGKVYTVGFAIHDDHAAARFHHVSIDYRLALDNPEAEINAVRVEGVATGSDTGQGSEKAAALQNPAPAAAPAGAVDWGKAAERTVSLLYPGQTSYEWVLNGPDHGGARAYKKGERCSGCHEGEQESMGTKMVTGEKAETTPIPGKPAAIPLTVRATHDGENLYMRFSWPAGAHAPAPFAEGGKMDPENQVKLALMIDQGTVADADRSGCWSSCHHDAKSMPDAPAGQEVTKYLPQTRTAIEVRDAPRGGWDKLKPAAELEQLMKDGVFLDLLRWKSGNGGVSEDGHVSDRRVMEGGQGVRFQGELKDGQWTVTMTRRLKSDKPGDVSIEPGKVYTVGFAIHDDHAAARFHHVSIDYRLALDNPEAEINAVRQ